MATLTDAIKTDLYRFFAVAFDAAPGTVYMGQLVEAVEKGNMSVAEIVDVFTGKPQFTNVYPAFMDNAAFAKKLVDNVVGSSATDAAKAEAAADVVAALNSGFSRGKVVFTIFGNLAKLTGDAKWGGTAAQMANQVEYAKYYTEILARDSTDLNVLRGVIANVTQNSSTSVADMDAALNPPLTAVSLTTGLDNFVGTSGADTFEGYVVNNSNTLQSGDKIDGLGGTDSLTVVLGGSADFAITPRTAGVENVFIRVQSTDANGNSSENNVQNTTGEQVTIDAQDMRGVKQWHNVDSRADLVIEDVRIQEGEITKDITIRMSNTDPGSMGGTSAPGGVGVGTQTNGKTDFEFYFSPESLRTVSNRTGSVLNLELMDTRAATNAATAASPLKDSPYIGFSFKLDGVEYKLTSKEFDDAQTYAQLLTAVQNLLKAEAALKPALSTVTASIVGKFSANDTKNNLSATGDIIQLKNSGSGVFAIGNYLTPDSGVPADSGLHTVQNITAPNTINDLITSTIILDNVGRESEAGNLIIGSMSTRTGVERFEITVENNDDTGNTTGRYTDSGSWLGRVTSTNNVLREVTAVNSGAVTSGPADYLYIGTGVDSAGNNLTSQRLMPNMTGTTPTGTILPVQPEVGAAAVATDVTFMPNAISDLLNPDGLIDVRLFDASAMTGQVKLGAAINATAVRKYQFTNGILNDTDADKAADQVAFVYKTGSANDGINLQIDGGTAASRTNTNTGRADFTFSVDGGAGNDHIQVRIVDSTTVGGSANWYINQDLNNNVTVDGGSGDDTIRTPGAGDVNILGGSGNDTIYTDNTAREAILTVAYNNTNSNSTTNGVNAVGVTSTWVVNTVSQLAADSLGGREINDLRGDANQSYNLYGSSLTVNFRGLTSTVQIKPVGYKTDDLTFNQAVKQAINNDAVLSKLLVAEDGAGNSLVIRALIDGVHSAANLSITVTAPAAGTLTATEVIGAATAYGLAAANSNEAGVLAEMATALTAFNARGDYVDQLAHRSNNNLDGSDAGAVTDNTITGGTGNDVIVLSRTVGADTLNSSNEVVVLGAGFGNDVVVNFNVGGNGRDAISLSGWGLTTAAPTIEAVVTTGAGANNSATAVAALYGATANAAASTVAHIVYSATTNTASLYRVVDPAGAGAATATLEGTVKLADTSWATVTASNFTALAANSSTGLLTGSDSGASGNNVLSVGGTSGNDTYVVWGAFGAGVYSGVDAAGNALGGASPVAGVRTVTGTIDLGAGSDTLITYGALDLTGATLNGIETIQANSGLRLKASQLQGRQIEFKTGTTSTGEIIVHKLVVVNDLTTGALDVSNIKVSGGALVIDLNNTPYLNAVVDTSTTGSVWNVDLPDTVEDALVPVTVVGTTSQTTAPVPGAAPLPTGTGGTTSGGTVG